MAEKSPANRTFLPAKTSHGHHQIELDCRACHSPTFESPQDACIECHGSQLKAAKDTHPASKFNDPTNADRLQIIDAKNCLTCHIEHSPHRTHAMGVTVPLDYCVHCHKDISDQRPSHREMKFQNCSTSGCHNYHDNRSLFEKFLDSHYGEPDTFDSPTRPLRDIDASSVSIAKALAESDHDAPAEMSDTEIIRRWAESAHALHSVNCRACHETENPAGQDKPGWSNEVSHAQCRECHSNELDGWLRGLHGMRVAQGLPAMTPSEARLPMNHQSLHESLSCNSCHGAHSYDTQFAAVDSCLQCHDDSHSRNYMNSAHFELWANETAGESPRGSGVSCATCHMPVEADASGRLSANHNQNDNLRPNEKMLRTVCTHCHGLSFAIDSLADQTLIENCFSGRPAEHVPSVDMAKQWFEDRKSKSKN